MEVKETEILVERLHRITIEDVGSEKWLQQHRAIEKLNMQACPMY